MGFDCVGCDSKTSVWGTVFITASLIVSPLCLAPLLPGSESPKAADTATGGAADEEPPPSKRSKVDAPQSAVWSLSSLFPWDSEALVPAPSPAPGRSRNLLPERSYFVQPNGLPGIPSGS